MISILGQVLGFCDDSSCTCSMERICSAPGGVSCPTVAASVCFGHTHYSLLKGGGVPAPSD